MSFATIKINKRELSLSNLEKDLYPAYGFTKAKILDYYSRIAPVLLPHLARRALTLKRYPEGVDKEFFYEKRCPRFRPPWMSTAQVPYGSEKTLTGCVVDSMEELMWVGNLASIELHVPLAAVSSPLSADFVVFDLDPGKGAGVLDCAGVALTVKGLLQELKLTSFIKTSGKKGLHVCVPLNCGASFESAKSFSKAIALTLEKNYPKLVTAKIAKQSREEKVFINWAQNDASKTMVCVYSLRAEQKPMVSFPLTWNEVEAALRQKRSDKLKIDHAEALRRVEAQGDLFKEMLVKKQKLPYV